MTLDYSKHKNILLQILKDIYSDSTIAPYLGFKGGTAALLFYGLDRNSVDLDFDLLDDTKEEEVFNKIQKITESYGTITESRIKHLPISLWLCMKELVKPVEIYLMYISFIKIIGRLMKR